MAWRSGTGGVALAMNSDNRGDSEPPTMDFCFANYGDGKWYKSNTITQEERKVKHSKGNVNARVIQKN